MSALSLPRTYAAIGDSFTEGMGDELADGTPRGWADLVALGLAHAAGEQIGYANLAIRGRLLGPILAEQLEPALTLRPELLSINGGGNDIMRPRVSVAATADRLVSAAERAGDAGIRAVIVSGANPTRHIPMGPVFQRRGDELADAVRTRLGRARHDIGFVDNWGDDELRALRYWSIDRLHLNSLGHARVASNVLAALGVPAPPARGTGTPTDGRDARDGAARQADGHDFDPHDAQRPRTAEYWRDYVLPWIGRRLTGRSSGDGRVAKRPTLEPIVPE